MANVGGQAKRSNHTFIAVAAIIAVMVIIVGYLTSQFVGRSPAVQSNAAASNSDIKSTSSEEILEDEPWALILVNKWTPVPDGYENDIVFEKLRYDQSVDVRIYDSLQKMMDDCRADGLSPMVCSGYRSQEKQQELLNDKIKEYKRQGYSEEKAVTEAEKWVAVPGTSEHHLGIAVDIISENYQYLDEKQEQTREQQWMLKNCWKYGFILRYPSGKSDLTGIYYEPWHYRYVGKKAAKYITENNLCLEEYLAMDNQ